MNLTSYFEWIFQNQSDSVYPRWYQPKNVSILNFEKSIYREFNFPDFSKPAEQLVIDSIQFGSLSLFMYLIEKGVTFSTETDADRAYQQSVWQVLSDLDVDVFICQVASTLLKVGLDPNTSYSDELLWSEFVMKNEYTLPKTKQFWKDNLRFYKNSK